MRMLLQRVSEASVSVEGKVVGRISRGLLVFLGIKGGDSSSTVLSLVNKLIHLRLFPDEADKMNLSIQETKGEILVVSQFTLYAECKGRRPSFSLAASPDRAQALYEEFVEKIREKNITVQTGVFGAKMAVSLCNEGPATFFIEG